MMKIYLTLAAVVLSTAACQADNPAKVQTTTSKPFTPTALSPAASFTSTKPRISPLIPAKTTTTKPIAASATTLIDPLKAVADTTAPLTEALNAGLRDEFKQHLRTYHSPVRNWSDVKLTQFIDAGAYKAWGYNFKNPRAIVKFLSLQVVLGQDFDTNPKYPWAKPILMQAENPKNNQARITALFDAAVKHLQAHGQ